MSTTIKDVSHYGYGDTLTVWAYEPDRGEVEIQVLDHSKRGSAVVSRADFLAAVEAELGVRIVPADAIVIDRADLPKLLVDTSHRVTTGSTMTQSAEKAWWFVREYAALAEYLDAHPPVDEEQVKALAGLLWEYAQNPSGPGDSFNETNEGERNRFCNRARRLLATGKVTVQP